MRNKETNSEKQECNEVLSCNNNAFDDNYLAENIVEARTNHEKACEIYRNYVGKAETYKERLRRINAFRCVGF